jgi:hypothetical protein
LANTQALGERGPPRSDTRRGGPWRHRHAAIGRFGGAHQCILRLADVTDPGSGAEMTPRNVE